MKDTETNAGENAHGTKGTAMLTHIVSEIDGKDGKWRSGTRAFDAHHQEHHDLFATPGRLDPMEA